MKTLSVVTCAVVGSLVTAGSLIFAQTQQPPPTPPAGVAGAPPQGGAGRGNRAPLTEADTAEIAKLESFPAWTPRRGRRQLLHRTGLRAGARADAEGRRAEGPGRDLHDERRRQQVLPRHRAARRDADAAGDRLHSKSVRPGTAAPFIVSCDAYGARNNQLPTILDNMIAERRLPPMIAVMIANGGGDGRGSERGLEYDTVSGKYAEFVEAEVLPRVEKDYGVTLTKDPDGRMTLGGSSGGSAAFNMAWFHPELYHRVLIYSGTFVNQHPDADYPRGGVGIPRSRDCAESGQADPRSGCTSRRTTTAPRPPRRDCTTGSSPTSAWPTR